MTYHLYTKQKGPEGIPLDIDGDEFLRLACTYKYVSKKLINFDGGLLMVIVVSDSKTLWYLKNEMRYYSE